MLWMSISLMCWIFPFHFYLPHFLISFPVKLYLLCLMLQIIVAFIPLICYTLIKTFSLFFVTSNCATILYHSHFVHIHSDITYFFPIYSSLFLHSAHFVLSHCFFIVDSWTLSWVFSTVMANFWQWFRTSVWRLGNYLTPSNCLIHSVCANDFERLLIN